MKIILIVAALSGMLIPALASAELDYNTVDVGYSTTSYSGSESSMTELDFGVSQSISEHKYLHASLEMGSLPTYTSSGTRRVTSLTVGAGYHKPLKDNVDAIAQGNLILGVSRLGGNSTSANGYDIGAGVRTLFRSGLEGALMVFHARISNGVRTSTDTFLGARLGYNFTEEVQMYAGIDLKPDQITRMGFRILY